MNTAITEVRTLLDKLPLDSDYEVSLAEFCGITPHASPGLY